MPGIRLPPTPKTGGVGSGLDDIAPITPPEPIPATGTGSGGGARDGVGEGVDPPSSQPGSSSGSGPESGSVPGESEPGSGNGNADKDKNKGDEELPEIPDPGSDDASPTTTVIMPAPSPDATVPVRLGTGTAQPDDATTSTASPTASPSSTAESTAESAAGSGLLPVWAIVLIVIGAVVFLVFVVSLVVFCIRGKLAHSEARLLRNLSPPKTLFNSLPSMAFPPILGLYAFKGHRDIVSLFSHPRPMIADNVCSCPWQCWLTS